MNISLDQARCFCALVDTGSYQAAALEMHRSHSAIVYAISCFEKQSGLTLLNRTEYRTTLTAAGERVYRHCRTLLESAVQLEDLCSQLSLGWEPKVRLVFDGVLSPDPFLNIFNFFKNQKITTTLDIYSDYLHGVEKSFIELEAEFMISVLSPKQKDLQALPLKSVANLLVSHKDHDLQKNKKCWSVKELKKFDFLTVRGADKTLNLGTKELEESSTFHLSDFSLKKMAILQGAGFGWLPEYMIEKELRDGTLKLVQSEIAHRQELFPHLYYKRKKSLGRAGQIIVEQLAKSQLKTN